MTADNYDIADGPSVRRGPALTSVRDSAGEATAGPAPPSAVVVAGDEETRVLLRGLLKLHRFRVVGEAAGATQGDELVRRHKPDVLVTDATLAEGSLSNLVLSARSDSPRTHIVLIQPASRPMALAAAVQPDATVARPFRIREFIEALRTKADATVPANGSGPAA